MRSFYAVPAGLELLGAKFLLIYVFFGNKGARMPQKIPFVVYEYFGGKRQEDMVFADVKYVGRQEFHKKREFTREACQLIHETIGTPIDRICLTITEFDNWGAVGDFRDQYFIDET